MASSIALAGLALWFFADDFRVDFANAELPAPKQQPRIASSPPIKPVAPAAVSQPTQPPPAGQALAAWRSLSQNGDYESAYRLLASGAPVADDPLTLMEAADTSSLNDDPERAVTYLRKVVTTHRASPTAPLAAFTLGRILSERLGWMDEAARAFATVQELAPGRALAREALARENAITGRAPDRASRPASFDRLAQ